jgi:hypothetical protein
MKLKATKTEIKNGYNKILRIGYCELQFLLKYESPFAYSAGIYGWSCDYYDIDNICISTGYSPIGEYVDRDIVRKYDDMAEGKTEEERKHLLKEFIQKVTN